MSTNEKKETSNINEAFAGMTPDQIKTELISQLVKKAKSKKNVLTYSDMADYLDAFDLDKNAVDIGFFVKLFDKRQKLLLRCIFIKCVLL